MSCTEAASTIAISFMEHSGQPQAEGQETDQESTGRWDKANSSPKMEKHKQGHLLIALQNTFISREYDFFTYDLL